MELLIHQKENELKLLLETFEKQEAEMLERHKQELQAFSEEYEKITNYNYNMNNDNNTNEDISLRLKTLIRPSKEFLNWVKIQETAMKQKNYEKAHEATVKIEELTQVELDRYSKEKKNKFKNELNKILKRHDIEKKGLEAKKNSDVFTFNKIKNAYIDSVVKKNKLKLNEVDTFYKNEINNLKKVQKTQQHRSSNTSSFVVGNNTNTSSFKK
jgi:hypothetical protein